MEDDIKVLVIDDDRDLLDALHHDLQEMRYTVFPANSAEEALKVISVQKIDIILSDLNMPNISGVELLRTLRGRGYQNPFIVLSGFGTREEAIELLTLGAYDFLTKPTSFEHLSAVLSKASEYVRILNKAKMEIAAKLGVESMDAGSHLEETIFALARMRALRAKKEK